MTNNPPASVPPPEERIVILNSSLRCFAYSLVGLIPFIGLPFSVAAMNQKRQIKNTAGTDWNPAGRYLKVAGRIAPLGFLSSAGFLVLFCLLVGAIGSGGEGGYSGSS